MPGFKVDYAKSGRAMCKKCSNPIAEGSLRVGKMVQSTSFDGEYPLWHHFECFFKRFGNEVKSEGQFADLDTLRWEDQEKIRNFVPGSSGGGAAAAPAASPAAAAASDDKKDDAPAPKKGGRKRKADAAVEEPKKAPPAKKRKTGKNANAEPEAPQAPVVQLDPEEQKRREALAEENKALWAIKEKLEEVDTAELKEMLDLNSRSSSGGRSTLIDRAAQGMLFGAIPACPDCGGHGLHCLDGELYKCMGQTQWGSCIYESREVKRLEWKIPKKPASDYLADFTYLAGRVPVKKIVVDSSTLKVELDTDFNKRKKKKKGEEEEEGASTGTKTYLVKGKSAVDPDSGMAEDGHILTKGGVIYNVMLNLTDVMRGRNSYYAIQIIESDKSKNDYHVFRKWGRTGSDIGGNKITSYDDKEDAIEEFESVYEEKTGNEFNSKNFVKRPGLFYPIELDFGTDEDEKKDKPAPAPKGKGKGKGKKKQEEEPEALSKKLDARLAKLIGLIFDVQAMQEALRELKVDVNRMPLGKLSKRHILDSYSILTEISELIKEKEPSKAAIVSATNRFYTAIPHYFAVGQMAPLIDNEAIIKEKTEMLDSLLDMEIANTIIKDRDANQSDPIADHYKKLNCELVPMDKTDPTYALIEEYVANTHAKTHNQFALEVQNIFVVDREGERERFDTQKRVTNRKLLWHGSRLTNFAGILSQGLRIAPKEAPVTGYMFGKGVYFADMVSKSANYCFTTPENNTGLLLLSEVALGKMHELTRADSSIEKAPKGCLCVKGLGQTMPDPDKEVPLNPNDDHDSKVIVPLGEGVPSGVKNTSLLYNEFIVYSTNQVRLRYLLQVTFKYKKGYY